MSAIRGFPTPSGFLTLSILQVPHILLRLFGNAELTSFDDLHRSQIQWRTLFVLALTLPTATAIRAVGHVLRQYPDLALSDASRFGSQLHPLITELGGIVSFAVLGTEARFQVIAALPGGEAVPGTIIPVWGALYALALAALYIPVHERWALAGRKAIFVEMGRQFPPSTTTGKIGFTTPELAANKELQIRSGRHIEHAAGFARRVGADHRGGRQFAVLLIARVTNGPRSSRSLARVEFSDEHNQQQLFFPAETSPPA